MNEYTITDAFDCIIDLNDEVDNIKEQMLELKKAVSVKRQKAVVTIRNQNLVIEPKEEELHIVPLFAIDKEKTIEGTKWALTKITNVMRRDWSHKPGFKIIQPVNACAHPNGIMYSCIIAVTKTHYSQMDVQDLNEID